MSVFSNSHLNGDAPHNTSSENASSRISSGDQSPVTTRGIKCRLLDAATLQIKLPYTIGVGMDSAELPECIGFQPMLTCLFGGSPVQVLRAFRAPRALGLAITLPEGLTLSDLSGDQTVFLSWNGLSGEHRLTFRFRRKKG